MNIAQLPAGTIYQDGGKIFKVLPQDKDQGEKSVRVLGSFSITILAWSKDKKYLIDVNGQKSIDTLDFQTHLVPFQKKISPNVFEGSWKDLTGLSKQMNEDFALRLPKPNLIDCQNRVGRYTDENFDFWIFKDVLVFLRTPTKKHHQPLIQKLTADGFVEVDGYWIAARSTAINPCLIPEYLPSPVPYSGEQFLSDWDAQLKSARVKWGLLGWILAGMYMDEINAVRQTSTFPIFLLTAKTHYGKTSFISNCIKILGVSYKGADFSKGTSAYVDRVRMEQVMRLPLWYDEYRNTKSAVDKQEWLKDVYGRVGAERADMNNLKGKGTTTYQCNATVLLTGEDFSDDAAVRRRLKRFVLTREHLLSGEDYKRAEEIAHHRFRYVFPLLIDLHFNVQAFQDFYSSHTFPGDTVEKDEVMFYAALAAVFGSDFATQAFTASLAEATDRVFSAAQESIEEDNEICDEWFSEVNAMFMRSDGFRSRFGVPPRVLDYFYFPSLNYNSNPDLHPKVYIHLKPLYLLWKSEYGRGGTEIWTYSKIRTAIIEKYHAFSQPATWADKKSMNLLHICNTDKLEGPLAELLAKVKLVQDELPPSLQDQNAALL